MNNAVLYPWVLLLLPLALLPWYRGARPAMALPWLALVPNDRASAALDVGLRALGSIALAALIAGLAGPYRSEAAVERVGRGTEIVLLLDRSRSMDLPFTTRAPVSIVMGASNAQGKISVARTLLLDFVARRSEDLFAMIEFSKYPIQVLDFTRNRDIVRAAIRSSKTGPGLEDTDIGRALETSLERFSGRPYMGSRIILLVSDGGARIEEETRQRIARLMKRERVSLYWLYLRSYRSPGLLEGETLSSEMAETSPEHALHEFFASTGMPYRAYEAENPRALADAMRDVDRLEQLPIRYTEILPRRDLSQGCFVVALMGSALLLAARLLEIKAWT